jgi:hypothetical protein
MDLGQHQRTIFIEPIELATDAAEDDATEAPIPEPGPRPVPARDSS